MESWGIPERLRTSIATHVSGEANSSIVRYAQVWEDADTLLKGLDIRPEDVCLSIASGGDNALAMLAKDPARVIAIDRNPAQLFCLELKVAAFRCLGHDALLELIGSRRSASRISHYAKCRPLLSDGARRFWDGKRKEIDRYGIGGVGRFERYFRIFTRWVLPIALPKAAVESMFVERSVADNERFFDAYWHRPALRLLVRGFFCRPLVSLLGQGVVVFEHVEGRFSDHVLDKIRHGLRTLRPSDNPYLHWILRGSHGDALPFALRPENYDVIRSNLDKLEWHLSSFEDTIDRCQQTNTRIDKFNMSNIFDYMPEEEFVSCLKALIEVSAPGARVIYWNMMVPRSCPPTLAPRMRPLQELATTLHAQDKAFFYTKLNIEEVA